MVMETHRIESHSFVNGKLVFNGNFVTINNKQYFESLSGYLIDIEFHVKQSHMGVRRSY